MSKAFRDSKNSHAVTLSDSEGSLVSRVSKFLADKSRFFASLRMTTLVYPILFLGFVLRAFQFSTNPPGLYFDEATIGYEAFSLLKTGADRWGLSLPIYFVNWGSGQSVLYSYLSIPFVALLGLSRFSDRLVSLFLGVLTLPLVYVTVKRSMGRNAGLIAMLLLAVLPWHVMISRWALDANLLPFFLLLGTYTMTRALSRSASRRSIVLALLPWGAALYAYALSFTVLPILLALIVLSYRKTILGNWKAWGVSAILFGILAFPLALFLFKNYFAHDTMGIERYLPFGIPLLLTNRIQYVSTPIPGRWIDTFFFIFSGFQQGDYHDSLVGNAPILMVFIPLCLIGCAYWVKDFRVSKRPDLFLLWMIAALPVLLLVDANVHRFNAVFIPMLAASVNGLSRLARALSRSSRARLVLATGVSALVALQVFLFVYDYFWVFPELPEYESAFTKNYDRAIEQGIALARPDEPILLQPGLEYSFIFTLFYTSYPPEQFHREVKYSTDLSEYWVRSFGRFYVGVENLPDPQGEFTYILGKWNPDPCPNPEPAAETRLWKVGRCEGQVKSQR